VLSESNLSQADPEAVSGALLEGIRTLGLRSLPWSEEVEHLRERLQFLQHHFPADWPDMSDEALQAALDEWLLPHLAGLRSLADVGRLDLAEILLQQLPGGWAQRQELDRLAPAHLEVPSGSHIRLDYADPAAPVLAVKLQEVFGLLDTPRIANDRVPLTMHLLSPAQRPVQVTRDLRSFWQTGYFEVRKDLRGRYPKHPWPEDPLTHVATKLTKKRLEQGGSH
jgi:ATP-dependent helicase HrpB